MPIIFFILSGGFGIFLIATMLLWAFYIQRYVELHGQRSASVAFNSAMWRDYQAAARIAKQSGRKPRFLVLFEGFSIAAILFFIAGIVVMVVGSMSAA